MKLALVIGIVFLIIYCDSKGLNEEFTWSRISYAPNNGVDLSEPSYIYENNIPMGVNRWNNKLFITLARRRVGIPSTLNYIWANSSQRHNVPLIPYPNFEINQLPSAGGMLVSVYRTAVDSCNRLWMVDTGLLEYPGNNTRVQQSAIIVIDLLTDQIIRRYELKASDMAAGTNLASIVIDVTPTTCHQAFAYMPDLGGYGMVVYSFEENNSWRVSHNYFFVEALAGEFNIGGIRFQWNDGVFSVALSELRSDGYRNAYFHSMAGHNLYSVSTKVLRNQTLATRSYHESDFMVELNRGHESQASSSDLHKTSGLLFFGLVNQNALGCWNTFTPAKPENFDVVYKNPHKFIYPCDVKVSGEDIIVLTNTMPVFLYRNLDYDQINFRIWVKNVYQAVKDTKCMEIPYRNSPPRPRQHY